MQVNSYSLDNLSQICNEKNATLIHFSTDYIYDNKFKSYTLENDNVSPLNVYGFSKLLGEYIIKKKSKKFFIFRVASLFGTKPPSGKTGNFVDTIYSKAFNGENLKVVNDQLMSPTSTQLISDVIYKIIKQGNSSYGIYNLSCKNRCSWFKFAKKIVKLSKFKVKVDPIEYKSLKMKTDRPLNSSMNTKKVRNKLKISLPTWEEELTKYMRKKKYI